MVTRTEDGVSNRQYGYILSLMDEKLDGELMRLGTERLGLEIPTTKSEASSVIKKLL